MGKKSKKLAKTEEDQPQLTNTEKSEDGTTNDSTFSVTKTKKKSWKRDSKGISVDTTEHFRNDTNATENLITCDNTETKKKKKKSKLLEDNKEVDKAENGEHIISKKNKNKGNFLKGISIEDTGDQIKNVANSINSTENLITTGNEKTEKKKNKRKLLEENKEDTKSEVSEELIGAKKKKNISVEESLQTTSELVKKNKKSKSRSKKGSCILNDEESKVTEEDINRFCDELDEEDNKQYEDWVKLLDARLSKKQPQNK